MSDQQIPQASWSPPAEYQPVSSAVEGISVYAPRKIDTAVQPVKETYRCPKCGAMTRYDVAAGGVACEFCGYQVKVEAKQVGTKADEHEFVLETLAKSQQSWGENARRTHCESCGAELIFAKEALAVTCPFCGSNRVSIRDIPADLLKPESLIPFKVKTDDVKMKAAEWLGKGWFHPAELKQTAGVDHFNGVYLPFWTFDAKIDSHWRAEVGYERSESYYDSSAKEWKTRTVIDWRWEDGDVSIDVDDLPIPGTSRTSSIILERIQPFDLKALVQFNPDFLAGWQAQMYDVNLPDAWEKGKDQMREQAKDACYQDIPTSHVRNFGMTSDFRDEVWRYVLLPIYISAYQFEEKTYQVMVNGQTGLVAGQKPVAWWKVWLAVAALLLPGLVLGLAGLLFIAVGGLVPLVLGAILEVIGGVFAVMIYKQAVASEAA